MFSRRAMLALRQAQPRRSTHPVHHVLQPVLLHMQRRHYADIVVKVPQMAESISEGTLAEWSKKVGDFIEQDEEIASIETDKVSRSPSPSLPVPVLLSLLPPFALAVTLAIELRFCVLISSSGSQTSRPMLPNPVSSRNSLLVKATPSPLAKTSPASSLEAPQLVGKSL